MPYSEIEIQSYIWENKEKWSKLFLDFPAFADIPNEPQASSLLRKIAYARAYKAHKRILSYALVGCEVRLRQDGDSTIRADFVAHEIDNPGIGIIELKKSGQTERQAFTELLAYANHFKSRLYTANKNDITLALIAPMEARIVREAYCNALIFDALPIVSYIPSFSGSLDTLRLTPILPDDSFFSKLSKRIFRMENFSLYKIVWMKDSKTWNSNEKEEYFNRLSALCSTEMEKQGISGFCFGQEWYDPNDVMFPNGLVIAGLNPWAVANSILLDRDSAPEDVSSEPREDWYFMRDIMNIPEIDLDEASFNILHNQHNLWDSSLFSLGRDLVNSISINENRDRIQIDQGQFTWKTYFSTDEMGLSVSFELNTSGLIKDIFWEYLTATRLDREFDILLKSSGMLYYFNEFIYDIANPDEFSDDDDDS